MRAWRGPPIQVWATTPAGMDNVKPLSAARRSKARTDRSPRSRANSAPLSRVSPVTSGSPSRQAQFAVGPGQVILAERAQFSVEIVQ